MLREDAANRSTGSTEILHRKVAEMRPLAPQHFAQGMSNAATVRDMSIPLIS
jgi:hypothetical protein